MADSTQNGAPVFVAPTPIIVDQGAHYTSPDSAYPQTYTIPQHQQQPSASFNYNVLIGKTGVIGLGVALLICGIISQAGAAVALRFYAALSDVGVGIWCAYMFMAAGVVAIVAAHHGTKNMIFGTTVTSGFAVVAAIIQLSVAAVGLSRDVDYYSCQKWCYPFKPSSSCPCNLDDWEESSIDANSTMVFAASMALICGIWLLLAGCIAVRRKQTSFQVASTPDQFVSDASQSNIHQAIRNEQMHSTSVQHVQQQQHQLHHRHPNTIHPPMSSQVVQMPAAYIPFETITTSAIPNQQMHSIPVQYVQQQQQQPMPLNHPQSNTIAPPTYQFHENYESSKYDDRDVEEV